MYRLITYEKTYSTYIKRQITYKYIKRGKKRKKGSKPFFTDGDIQ